MPYDPTLPANNAPIVSAELRNQFAGLKTLIDQRPTSDDVATDIRGGSANNVEGLADLSLTVSNPPTQTEVQAIVTKLNELIDGLQH